jgi:hypothetical protein
MWNKQQIQALKEKAHYFISDDYIREHLTALNFHLSIYEGHTLVYKKQEKWVEVEAEANHIRARIFQMAEKRDVISGTGCPPLKKTNLFS